ncbi:hypothetical protein [Microseira wollei]|uniref:Uncharacterized protein n=1 Tax=Microseira wollei NIES-4236 TaxID=2530354 RepID=A0AAV3X9K4_9CYAN|nr:hypothetical protein [Microseira wollei]GET37316.1 hypothetical protein MiSe_20690 [Microseira wollei NIES-4236]
MIKLVSDRGDRSDAYQQALDDFGITQLLSCISNYRDRDFDALRMSLKQQELEDIATLLIEQLSANLKGAVLANNVLVIRNRVKLQRPWMIVRILPGAKTHAIARFVNRQDADDRLRALRRYVPNATFEIVFDLEES